MNTYLTTRRLLQDAYFTASIFRDPVTQQCRGFNLMYSASTKIHRGNHKNKNYFPFTYSTKTPCELELWDFKPHVKIGQMTLDEALEKHIKPGVVLLPMNEPWKGEAPRHPEQYVLLKINTETTPPNLATSLKGHSKPRGAKQAFIHTWADMWYCKLKLERAYHMLRHKLCVEFHVCEKRRGDRNFRSDSRLFEDLVHLRPEVILRAMPEQSGMLIDPQTNYQEFCWVVGPPRKAKTGELVRPDNVTKKFYNNRKVQLNLEKQAGTDTK